MATPQIAARAELSTARTVVIKVGSSLLASLSGGLDHAQIERLSKQIASLRRQKKLVLLVSSGAVAAGMVELDLRERPRNLPAIQAAAAVGQTALMDLYRRAFAPHRLLVGQVLLTVDGLRHRQRFLRARDTLRELLALGVVPIINENDTVAVDELKLRLGDNDSLAVNVAQLVAADCLIILSDVPGLYDRHPNEANAERISQVDELTDSHYLMAGAEIGKEKSSPTLSNEVGTGGMETKLTAAQATTMAGIPLVVADGREAGILDRIFSGADVGTFFAPRKKRTTGWKQWIAFSRQSAGTIQIDEGACAALLGGKKSLLAIGVTEIKGDFSAADTVSIVNSERRELARGLVNFSTRELQLILGHRNCEHPEILGYDCGDTVVHRDNLLVMAVAEG